MSPFVAPGNKRLFPARPPERIEQALNCRGLDAAGHAPLAHPRCQRDETGVREWLRACVPGGRQPRHDQLYPARRPRRIAVYKRDRVIMDEERVLSAIEQAGCQPSRVGIAEHLRKEAPSPGGFLI